MPIIYLSPSTQEWNYYVNGGTEEEYMNLLADKMVPYLDASAVSARNLYVLANTSPASVFVELGNIQNTFDQRRFVISSNRQALAKWMMEGFITDYKKAK